MYLYSELTEQEQLTLDAYARLAANFGRKDLDDPENVAQNNASLWWYFCAVQNGTAQVNDLLQAFLSGARAVPHPAGEAEPDWAAVMERTVSPQLKANPNQYRAVSVALTQPISFVQGPPGTGKTETILNLLSCIVAGGKTAAIVSPTNAAVENVIQKVKQRPKGWSLLAHRLARLGNKDNRVIFNREPRLDGTPHPFHFRPAPDDCPRDPDVGFRLFSRDGIVMTVRFEPTITAEEFLNEENFSVVASSIHSLKRCFANGIDFQYDYLIMDEASQTDTLLGLVAMSCAKRLVLVGDLNQLPPVTEELYREAGEERCPEGGFLELCTQRFQAEENTVLLNWHFRCHPGIVDFCNQTIYDGRLKCMTGKDGVAEFPQLKEQLDQYYAWQFGPGCTSDSFPFPIRILWFRGNYSERYYHWSEVDRREFPSVVWASRTNRKQIEIFWREELPRLRQRLQIEPPDGMEPLSVAFLCPYKGLLEELHTRLKEAGIPATLNNTPNSEEERDSPLNELTIHRSQGREYDIVYFFPVDDGMWEWPWSQKRNLINVAVSRAKRELRIIASTSLMPPYMQRALAGPNRVASSRGRRAARAQNSDDELFLQKLMTYLWNRGGAWQNGEFGFHESALTSLYDDVPLLRRAGVFAPEECMKKLLAGAGIGLWNTGDPAPEGWSFRTEVLLCTLKDAQGQALTCQGLRALLEDPDNEEALTDDRIRRHLTQKAWELLESKKATYLGPCGGRFDFVLYQGGMPRLAIEVDGGFHRKYQNVNAGVDDLTEDDPLLSHHINDLLKDWIAERMMGWPVLRGNRREELVKLGGSHCAMLRLPNDGSTFGETDALRSPPLGEQVFSLEELLALLTGGAPCLSVPAASEEAASAPTETQINRLCRDIDFLAELAGGVDPLTHAPLPADSVLRDPNVQNDLSDCKAAVEKIAAYDVHRVFFAPDPVLRRTLRSRADPRTLRQMAADLSAARNERTHWRLSSEALRNYLQDKGLLEPGNPDAPTAEGLSIGLTVNAQRTIRVSALQFSPRAQQWLIDHLDELAENPAVHRAKPTYPKRVAFDADCTSRLLDCVRTCQSLARGQRPGSGQSLAPSDPACAQALRACFDHTAQALSRAAELGHYSAIRPFSLTPEQWANLLSLALDESRSLPQFVALVNSQADPTAVKSLHSSQLTEILCENGFITNVKVPQDGIPWDVTPKGAALGLTAQLSLDSANPYEPLVCSPESQRYLISKLEKFVAY